VKLNEREEIFMNKVILMGRLTRDPEVRYSNGENAMAVARFTLAVDRRYARKDGEQTADFISCVAFGKNAEFIEKYFRQGMRVTLCGRIQTGSYTNRDGQKVYTTDVVIEEQEFAESKGNSGASSSGSTSAAKTTHAPAMEDDGFMQIPDGMDEELPFN
jgi:single-strand DNA-binding protein